MKKPTWFFSLTNLIVVVRLLQFISLSESSICLISPNIVFILSIDKSRLKQASRQVYGAEINATEYLRRFFNLEYGIPTADTQLYTNSLITRLVSIQYLRSEIIQLFDMTDNTLSNFSICSQPL